MRRIVLVAMGMVLFIVVNVHAYDDGDFQVWNTEVEEIQLKKDLKLAFEQEFRWGDNASELYYQHYDAGLFYSLNKHWSVGAGYRHILNKSKGKFLVENQPYATLTFASQFAGFKYDDRSRFEYNHFDYKDDTGTYRNKLTVKAPWKFTKFEIQPYVSDEIFILIDDGQRLNKNRASAGLIINITKNFKGDIYYMLQSSKSTHWTKANILGTKFKLSF
ncbi:MAG: hypothetical protein COV71_04940 [Candidatus Omnitrophica bacterium CG11_big_fil_rev_8_21_14_0_20_41_12]|nr:MAG: hypothetical protein COV71_04940 [Candidatus Omnitrophica bacterium CG11_big_fil_rev_8_21_14_0_20_41_12]